MSKKTKYYIVLFQSSDKARWVQLVHIFTSEKQAEAKAKKLSAMGHSAKIQILN